MRLVLLVQQSSDSDICYFLKYMFNEIRVIPRKHNLPRSCEFSVCLEMYTLYLNGRGTGKDNLHCVIMS